MRFVEYAETRLVRHLILRTIIRIDWRRGEAKSRGIKIRIPADGILGKKSVVGGGVKGGNEMRDFATERQKERDRKA